MRALAGLVLVAAGLIGCSDADGSGSGDTDPGATGPGPSSAPSSAEGPAIELDAAFDYEVDLGEVGPTHCPVAAVRFTDQSEGDPTAWEWEFDDGTTTTEQHPVVRHEVLRATLTVTRGDETDTTTQSVSFPVC